MKPVYRITLGSSIVVFSVPEGDVSLHDLKWEYLYAREFLRWYDGSKFDVAMISDIRKFDVECPVMFTLRRGGIFMKLF